MTSVIIAIAVIGLVVLIVAGIAIGIASRKTTQASIQAQQQDHSAYEAQVDVASQRLLTADETVRSASDELDFARAQFGVTQTQNYALALENARTAVMQAFSVHTRLQSQTLPHERASSANEIIGLLDRAMPPLMREHKQFVNLRNKEASVGDQLREVRTLVTETATRLPAVDVELDALAVTHSREAIASLEDNPGQARALLDSARTACDRAESLIDSDRALALRSLETARRAVAMATQQIDAVLRASDDLSRAHDRLTEAIASLTSDLSDVTTLGADQTAFAPLVADAQAAIERGRMARQGQGDPLAALEALSNAEEAIDAALEPLRSRSQSEEKSASMARRRLDEATAAVDRARAFVNSRRGLVSLNGRSALSNAEVYLNSARAMVDSNPSASIRDSERALSYADQVMSTPLHSESGLGDFAKSNVGAMVGGAVLGAVLSGALGKADFDFDLDHIGGGFLDGFDFD